MTTRVLFWLSWLAIVCAVVGSRLVPSLDGVAIGMWLIGIALQLAVVIADTLRSGPPDFRRQPGTLGN